MKSFTIYSLNSVVNDMNVMQRAQNYWIHFIFNLHQEERVTQYYVSTSILKLSDLKQFQIIVLTYSILNSGLQKNLEDRIK